MKPTGKFSIHYTATPNLLVLCRPNGQAVTTLAADRVEHLHQLFRPEIAKYCFEEEVFRLVGRVGSKSELRTKKQAARTRNRWASRPDLTSRLEQVLGAEVELYSDPLNKSLTSLYYHSLYEEDVVFSAMQDNAIYAWDRIGDFTLVRRR